MAKAKIFFRFDGAGNAWQGPFGEGSSVGADNNTAQSHAERQAWREAQKKLQGWYDTHRTGFAGQGVEVKIWVDNIVCPQCQLWMIAGVLRNLAAFEFKPKLIVEVKNMGGTRTTQAITRNYVWPVDIGHHGFEKFEALKGLDMND
ncbi:hypothetical protein [Methylomicrobium lacus]|uniref:hypothetical protein n=1 Tax=Methylomicrobium lacus TaxID=136992 RepID=UPI00045E99DE|nr:hypothetical protein [Methylomicrobium lacus]